jgi:hypothetical protein
MDTKVEEPISGILDRAPKVVNAFGKFWGAIVMLRALAAQ